MNAASYYADIQNKLLARIANALEDISKEMAISRVRAAAKSDARKITYQGRTLTLAEWAKVTGKKYADIYNALRRGRTEAQALGFEPKPPKRKAGK